MAASKHTKTTKEKSARETRVLVEDSLKRYLADIRKYPILTKPEEFRLARCYTEDNDSTAAMQLITDLGIYDEWSRKSATRIAKLDKASYPVVNEKGVDATNFAGNMLKEDKL